MPDKQIGDIVFWDTVSGLKSGKILDWRVSVHGIEYKVSRPEDKVCVDKRKKYN